MSNLDTLGIVYKILYPQVSFEIKGFLSSLIFAVKKEIISLL